MVLQLQNNIILALNTKLRKSLVGRLIINFYYPMDYRLYYEFREWDL